MQADTHWIFELPTGTKIQVNVLEEDSMVRVGVSKEWLERLGPLEVHAVGEMIAHALWRHARC